MKERFALFWPNEYNEGVWTDACHDKAAKGMKK